MRYKITEYTLNRADQLNVIVKPSEKRFKKIDVFDKNGNYIVEKIFWRNQYYVSEKGQKRGKKRLLSYL